MKTVTMCVTGHRPTKLIGGYDYEKNIPIKEYIMETLKNFLENNKDVGELICISGMALGIDMIFADAVLTLREEVSDKLKLVCALPFENQTGNWFKQDDIDFHQAIQDFADEVVILEPVVDKNFGYFLNKRNHYMVDRSDFVLAFWNGTKGGTGNCVEYAKKQGKPVVVKTFGLVD